MVSKRLTGTGFASHSEAVRKHRTRNLAPPTPRRRHHRDCEVQSDEAIQFSTGGGMDRFRLRSQ